MNGQKGNVASPQEIITILIRRRWLLIVPFLAVMTIGTLLAIKLPKVYQSRTLILIEPQRVPTNLVQTVVASDINERISTISQQIKSRTNLEKIIEQYRLFSDPKYDKMFIEDKIEYLSKKIEINVNRDPRVGTSAFQISFLGQDPVTVMKVTNTLAQLFIEENLKVRENQATGTSEFLESELQLMRRKLEAQEAALKSYRERYMGGLPEQLQSNLMVLERLQAQLSSQMQSLRDARNRVSIVESQQAALSRINEQSSAGTSAPSSSQTVEAAGLASLVQQKSQLASLRARYTDKHPDVVRLSRSIAEMEAAPAPAPEEKAAASSPSAGASPTQALSGMQSTRSIQSEIGSIEASIANLNQQIAHYQKQVEDTPRREQELLTIQRDYDNIKATYTSLLNRKLEADISVNMEKKQKGERFRVLDPARTMERPFSPNMQRLFLMTLSLAIGLGIGLVFITEYMDTSLRHPDDATAVMGVPVVAVLPTILHPADIRRNRLMNGLSVAAVGMCLFLTVGLASISFLGIETIFRIAKKVAVF